MPELPEVETIVRQLKLAILYKTITGMEVIDKRVVDNKIKKQLPSRVINVYRRGKTILIGLDNQKFLLIQLRMTGHFHYLKKGDKSRDYEKYLSCKFNFDDGSLLTHNSIRRFGCVRLLNESQLKKELAKIGPEPLSSRYTTNHFLEDLGKFPSANLKNKLLDQQFLAGIGNIYAQEAMYYAGIDPRKNVNEVSISKRKMLFDELRRVLKLSIKNKGTTAQNYAHIEGKGNFQNLLVVYKQKYCPKKHKLEKISIGGRGTYFCPKCQK